jgi:hypothetical protein
MIQASAGELAGELAAADVGLGEEPTGAPAMTSTLFERAKTTPQATRLE